MKCGVTLTVLMIAAVSFGVLNNSISKADSAEAEVRAVEAARTAALTRNDVSALEKLMADDITYVHASGASDTKSTYLDAIRSGQLHYLSFQPRRINVRLIGDAAVLDGMYSVRVNDIRVQKDPLELNVFFLTVYAHRDGRWQQIAWQTTRAPATVR